MAHRQSAISAARGFYLVSTTLILVFIIISYSLSFAHIQVQRIQRNDLNLNYFQANMAAENELDLFYAVLYESPELLDLVSPCTNLTLDPRQLVTANDKIRQYQFVGNFYLCLEQAGYFNVSIILNYNRSEQIVLQRRLMTISKPWVWHPITLFGF